MSEKQSGLLHSHHRSERGNGLEGRPVRAPSSNDYWQPLTQRPRPSNSIVLPLSAGYAGRPLSWLANAAASEPGRSLPPSVDASFVCDMITDAGRTSSFMAYAADAAVIAL